MSDVLFPLFQSHKQVRAAEIQAVDRSSRRIFVSIPAGEDDPNVMRRHPVMVEDAWIEKFDPKPGDWLMKYADGYMSVSPANAMMSGYTSIDEDEANDEWKPKEAEPAEDQHQADPTAPSSGVSFGGGQG